jgi:hypothetical protein
MIACQRRYLTDLRTVLAVAHYGCKSRWILPQRVIVRAASRESFALRLESKKKLLLSLGPPPEVEKILLTFSLSRA